MDHRANKNIAEQLRKLLLEFHNFGGELHESLVGVNQVARHLKCSPSSVTAAFKKLGFKNHGDYVRICNDYVLLRNMLQRLAGDEAKQVREDLDVIRQPQKHPTARIAKPGHG